MTPTRPSTTRKSWPRCRRDQGPDSDVLGRRRALALPIALPVQPRAGHYHGHRADAQTGLQSLGSKAVSGSKRIFVLAHAQARAGAIEAARAAPEGFVVAIGPATRSLEQNAAQWPILEAFSEQLPWPVNGRMEKLTAEEFKDVLTAAFQRETVRLAMGLDGGVVMLGLRTSKFGKAKFSEWMDFLHATAADRDVVVYAENEAVFRPSNQPQTLDK